MPQKWVKKLRSMGSDSIDYLFVFVYFNKLVAEKLGEDYKIFRLYPKAINDLENIYLYSAREFGLQRTEDYILAIESSFQYLANDPLISRKCDYIHQNLRAFNAGSHVIF